MKPTARDYYYLIWGICFSWFTSYLNETVSLVLLTFTLIFFFRSLYKKVLIAILVFPIWFIPTWTIGSGIKDYMEGNAKLQFYGYSSPNAANMNTEYRMGNRVMGCLVSDVGLFKSRLYNTTVKKLVKKFGYQKGSYTGEIPTLNKALSLLADASAISCEMEIIRKDKLVFWKDAPLLELNLREQHGMFSQSIRKSERIEIPKIYTSENFAITQFNKDWIYLIDTEHKKIIKYYGLGI